MSGEYRDELSAAHARIAELEEKVRSLEEEAQASRRLPPTGQFPELEQKVALFAAAADETANAKRRTRVAIVSAAFPIFGMIFSFLHLPLFATVCSAAFMALLAVNFGLLNGLKKSKARLADAQKDLRDAQHIYELETKLAEAEHVRIAPETPGAEALGAEPEEVSASEADRAVQALR